MLEVLRKFISGTEAFLFSFNPSLCISLSLLCCFGFPMNRKKSWRKTSALLFSTALLKRKVLALVSLQVFCLSDYLCLFYLSNTCSTRSTFIRLFWKRVVTRKIENKTWCIVQRIIDFEIIRDWSTEFCCDKFSKFVSITYYWFIFSAWNLELMLANITNLSCPNKFFTRIFPKWVQDILLVQKICSDSIKNDCYLQGYCGINFNMSFRFKITPIQDSNL